MGESLAIATVTWARSEKEHKLIINTLKALSKNFVVPIIAVDGGSKPDFLQEVKSLNGLTLFEFKQQGLLNQVKKSLFEASKLSVSWVLYLESDKLSFVLQSLQHFLNQADVLMSSDKIGMILPARNDNCSKTYPLAQQEWEKKTDKMIANNIKSEVYDFTYGPRIIKTNLVCILEELKNSDVGWGWMSWLLIKIYQQGFKIKTVSMNIKCSEDQVNFDEDPYRQKQHEQHRLAVELATNL